MRIKFFGKGNNGRSHDRQIYGISATQPNDPALHWEGLTAIGNVNRLNLGGPNYQVRMEFTREDVLGCLNSLFLENPTEAQTLVAEAQAKAFKRLVLQATARPT